MDIQTRLYFYEILIVVLIILTVALFLKNRRVRKLNQQLAELNGFRDGLTRIIAHDLKNYIGQVLYFSGEWFDESPQVINDAGMRMLNIVKDISDVRKFENDEMLLEFEAVNLTETAVSAMRVVRLAASEQHISITDNIPAHLVVLADADMIKRVFFNLLDNAVKYTFSGGSINLDAEMLENNMVKVMVTDTGAGVPPEQQPLIFDKFQLVKPRKNGEVVSTGLGLTFCKFAVESHGGEIGVVSETGKGSTFWFTLRCHEPG